MRYVLASLLFLGLVTVAPADDTLPIEETNPDPKLAKIVLIPGAMNQKTGEHEYVAACYIMRNLLKQTPGVFPVVVKQDWPTKPETLAGAKCVVFIGNGGGTQGPAQKDHPLEMDKLKQAKVGLVHLHAIIDYPKDMGDRVRDWFGGAYEPKYSLRAHWVTTHKDFAPHPVFHGVTPFKIDDGYLYKTRFVKDMKGVTPMLRTKNPKDEGKPIGSPNDDIVSWAYDRPEGGRSFVFTGGHLHVSFQEEGYRKFLINSILWSAGIEVPKDGAPVKLDRAELEKHLDPTRKK